MTLTDAVSQRSNDLSWGAYEMTHAGTELMYIPFVTVFFFPLSSLHTYKYKIEW